MDEYLCRTAFLYCNGRNGTFDKALTYKRTLKIKLIGGYN